VYIYIHTHKYIYIHTHAHKYIYTYTDSRKRYTTQCVQTCIHTFTHNTGSSGPSEERIVLHKNVVTTQKTPTHGPNEIQNESMVDTCLVARDQTGLVTTTVAPRPSLGGTKDHNKPTEGGVTADGGTPRYMTNSPRFNSLAVPPSPQHKPTKEKDPSQGTRIVAPSPRLPLASGDGWSVTYEGKDGTPMNTNRSDASVIRSPRARRESMCVCIYIYICMYMKEICIGAMRVLSIQDAQSQA
jgi:hypothetical protein